MSCFEVMDNSTKELLIKLNQQMGYSKAIVDVVNKVSESDLDDNVKEKVIDLLYQMSKAND